jgi:hypothetical protein
MLSFTFVHRQHDGLPLSADVGSGATGAAPSTDSERLKASAKQVLRRFTTTGAPPGQPSPLAVHGHLVQIDGPDHTFVVLADRGVLFLTMNAGGGPAPPASQSAVSVATRYLEEVAREFHEQYGTQVDDAKRPFPFIRFESFLQRTKKAFLNSARGGAGVVGADRAHPTRVPIRVFLGFESASSAAANAAAASRGGKQKAANSTMVIAGVTATFVLVVVGIAVYVAFS